MFINLLLKSEVFAKVQPIDFADQTFAQILLDSQF